VTQIQFLLFQNNGTMTA